MYKITVTGLNSAFGTNYSENGANAALAEKLNALGVSEADVEEFRTSDGYVNRPKNGYHALREFVKWAKAKRSGEPAKSTPRKKQAVKQATKATPKPAETKPAENVVPAETVIPAEKSTPGSADEAFMDALKNLMVSIPTKPAPAVFDEDKIREIVDERIQALSELFKPAEKRIVIETPRGEHEFPAGTVLHEEFADILHCVQGGTPVYLYGPSGSGKSEIAKQVAEALNLPFYFTGKVDLAYDLLGYNDAGGHYVETPFYKAVKNGGLFLFDEIDASSEEALTAFNAVLNSGECAFPCGIIQAHENFRVMAAGNTCGLGGTGMYNSRRKLDEATRNRFVAKFEVGYDPKIEAALGGKDTVEFVQAVREAADTAGIELIMSYRNIKFLDRYASVLGEKQAVRVNVLNGLSDDDRRTICRDSRICELVNAGNRFAAVLG